MQGGKTKMKRRIKKTEVNRYRVGGSVKREAISKEQRENINKKETIKERKYQGRKWKRKLNEAAKDEKK